MTPTKGWWAVVIRTRAAHPVAGPPPRSSRSRPAPPTVHPRHNPQIASDHRRIGDSRRGLPADDLADEQPWQVRQARMRLMAKVCAGDAAVHLDGYRQGVDSLFRPGDMGGPAGKLHLELQRAAVGGMDGEPRRFAADGITLPWPLAGQGVFGAQPRAVMVHHGLEDQVPGKRHPGGRLRGRGHRGDRALHVRDACGVHPAVLDPRVERVVAPPAFMDSGVEVAVQDQREARSGALDRGDHIGAPGDHLLDVYLDAGLAERLGDRLGDFALGPAGGGDGAELPGQLGDPFGLNQPGNLVDARHHAPSRCGVVLSPRSWTVASPPACLVRSVNSSRASATALMASSRKRLPCSAVPRSGLSL